MNWRPETEEVFGGAYGYSCLSRVPQADSDTGSGDRTIGLL